MSTIQDSHVLEERIYGIVQEYIKHQYGDDGTLTVSDRSEKLTLTTSILTTKNRSESAEAYLLKDIVRAGEDDTLDVTTIKSSTLPTGNCLLTDYWNRMTDKKQL